MCNVDNRCENTDLIVHLCENNQGINKIELPSGRDENTDPANDEGRPICGYGETLRPNAKITTCDNPLYLCRSGEPGFVELSDLCDGIETCENENEVCSVSRKKDKLETKVSSFNKGLTKKLSFCLEGLQELKYQNLSCANEDFIFPDHDFYGVDTKAKLILPEHSQNCDHMFGEQYVYTSCTGKCTNSTCPLKTIPRYEVCPSQFPKRVGTLANNKYLAFFTVSRGNIYTNRYFVCENNQTCLDYSQVCDLVKDCDDGSDEKYCTNHFKCNTSGFYIPKTSKCDGKLDCPDSSDECNESCSKQILQGNTALKASCWLIGGLAFIANIIILVRHATDLRKSKNAVVLANKSLMILICLGDFLTGCYLISISIYDSLIFNSENEYCKEQIEWITSTECSLIGILSTIGSQISLFSMTGLSIVRIYVICTSRSKSTSSRINITNIVLIVGFGLLIVLASVAIAVIPVIGQLEDFFVNGIRFRDELKIFIGTTKKETALSIIGAYYGRISNKVKLSWKTVIATAKEMFSRNYKDHASMVKRVDFYGNDGVCLFKYFVNTDDPQRLYVWSILALNFFCFLFISISYLLILLITKKSSNVTRNQTESKPMNSMNRKIAFIITTDFFCWIPFIIVCALHFFEVLDATPWYTLFSILILPINSLINPFLYDDFFIDAVRAKLIKLSSILSSFAVFSSSRNSTSVTNPMQPDSIEMQEVEV